MTGVVDSVLPISFDLLDKLATPILMHIQREGFAMNQLADITSELCSVMLITEASKDIVAHGTIDPVPTNSLDALDGLEPILTHIPFNEFEVNQLVDIASGPRNLQLRAGRRKIHVNPYQLP